MNVDPPNNETAYSMFPRVTAATTLLVECEPLRKDA